LTNYRILETISPKTVCGKLIDSETERNYKNRFWNFSFDFGDLIENNKFIELETVLKIIENAGDQRKIWLLGFQFFVP